MRPKALIILVISVVTLTVLAAGGYLIYAQKDKSYPSIVEKLAQKFNVDEEEVIEVFEEQKEEIEKKQKERLEQRLNTAVQEGKITEGQKKVILDKLAKIQEKHEELLKLRRELKDWAVENDIDLREILKLGHGHAPYGRHGPRGHFGSPMFW